MRLWILITCWNNIFGIMDQLKHLKLIAPVGYFLLGLLEKLEYICGWLLWLTLPFIGRTRAEHRGQWRGWAGDSEAWPCLGFWPTCDRPFRAWCDFISLMERTLWLLHGEGLEVEKEGSEAGVQVADNSSASCLSCWEESVLMQNPGLESHCLDLHLGCNTKKICDYEQTT